MVSIRIPVSLKFEKESSFYAEFISDLRTDRKLTDLITDLLRLYYEDEQLRSLINVRLESINEFSEVYSQLDKIQMQHNQTMMATAMLASQNQGIIKSLEQEGMLDQNFGLGSQPDNQAYTMNIGGQPQQPTAEQTQQLLAQQQQAQQSDGLEGLVKRMEAIEQMMPMLTKITQMLEGGQVPSMQAVQQQQVIQPQQAYTPTSVPPTQVQVAQQEPVIVTPTFIPTTEPIVEQAQPVTQQAPQVFVEQPIITPTESPVAPTLMSAPTFDGAPQIDSAPSQVSIGGAESVPVESVQPKTPLSFGKALSSMKKKS